MPYSYYSVSFSSFCFERGLVSCGFELGTLLLLHLLHALKSVLKAIFFLFFFTLSCLYFKLPFNFNPIKTWKVYILLHYCLVMLKILKSRITIRRQLYIEAEVKDTRYHSEICQFTALEWHTRCGQQ